MRAAAALLVVLGALVALPSAAAAKAEFLVSCTLDHRLAADPIVHAGHARGGHLHDFFGNTATDGRSTPQSLRRTPTSCTPKGDRSAYWVPTLFEDGRPLRESFVTIYYTVDEELAAEVRPFPEDLVMIAGNARENRPVPGAPNVWSCFGAGGAFSSETIPRCPKGAPLELILNFPDCWDGRRSDARDHQSHMAYSAGGACPESHPVAVPQIQFEIGWPTRGGKGVRLACGVGFCAHGDFMNGWNPRALQRRIADCLKPVVKCGADGRPL